MRLVSNANRAPTAILPIKGLTDENKIAWNNFLTRNPQSGLLKVQTTTANGLLPITDARVVIEKTLGPDSFVIGESLTDINGQTEMFRLPAPDKAFSLAPGTVTPYSFYTIKITHPQYRDIPNFDVPIFDGITSVQPVRMIPNICSDYNLFPCKIFKTEPHL